MSIRFVAVIFLCGVTTFLVGLGLEVISNNASWVLAATILLGIAIGGGLPCLFQDWIDRGDSR